MRPILNCDYDLDQLDLVRSVMIRSHHLSKHARLNYLCNKFRTRHLHLFLWETRLKNLLLCGDLSRTLPLLLCTTSSPRLLLTSSIYSLGVLSTIYSFELPFTFFKLEGFILWIDFFIFSLGDSSGLNSLYFGDSSRVLGVYYFISLVGVLTVCYCGME